MAQREYKQLGCQDLGENCGFLIQAETGDEVMSLAGEHICQAHGRCELSPEFGERMKASMKSVCCDGECYNAPKMTGYSCWDAS